jgi:hypothetical protein
MTTFDPIPQPSGLPVKPGFRLRGKVLVMESALLLEVVMALHERRLVPETMTWTRTSEWGDVEVVVEFAAVFEPLLPELLERLFKIPRIEKVEVFPIPIMEPLRHEKDAHL